MLLSELVTDFPMRLCRLTLLRFSLILAWLLTSHVPCLAGTEQADQQQPDLTEMTVEQLMNVEIETVYAASKHEQKVTDAPAAVSIVTADEIGKYGYRTLADILRAVRGLFVTYDRNYATLGIRGFNRPGDLNTRVLLLVDGHRINDNIYESAPIGTEFPIDVDLIERVEVIRGPGSSLYGTNAFFGVINVITRAGAGLSGAELSGAAASFDTYNGRVSYGNQFENGLEMLLSASIMDSRGDDRLFFREFAGPATNNGIAEHADYDNNYQLFSKLSYRDFTLTGAYASREKGIPTASYETIFNSDRTRTIDEHGFLDLKYSRLFSDRTELTARLYYDRFHYHGDYLNDKRANPGDAPREVLNKDLGSGYWWGGEALATRTFFGRNRISAGAEYRDNYRQYQGNHDIDPPANYLDDRRNSTIWALYLQDEISLLDNLSLSAGIRYDHYSSFGGTFNPRLALIYKPRAGSILKLLYGEAFRAPSVFESYYNDGGQTGKSNPALKPEKIRTYELVYEQYLGEHIRSSLSGFYYRIDDLISQKLDTADGLIQFDNIDSVDVRGVELELEGKWANGLQGRLSYTYQDSRDLQTGKTLTNSPQHLAKLSLIAPIYRDKLMAGLEEQFTSRRTTLAGSHASAYHTVNLTLFSRNLLAGLDLSATLYNLFDERYGDPGAAEHRQDIIGQDGRTFRVKLTYQF
jgi:iron complex outermembrane receptor protein